MIWNFFLGNLANLGHFFSWKILCIGRNHIFQVEIWQYFAPQKKHLCLAQHKSFKIKIWTLLKQIWYVVNSSFGLLYIGYKSKTEGTGYGIKWELLGTSWGTHWKLEEHIENLQICWKQSEIFMGTNWEQQKSNTPALPQKENKPGITCWMLPHIIGSKKYLCQPAVSAVVGVH
jgi:hypothetical protein